MDLPLTHIQSKESPREIIFKDFNLNLPISGGWGYSKEDAVVIDKNDPIVTRREVFDGVQIEYVFAEKRIYEEMIIFRPKDHGFAGIRWNCTKQEIIKEENKYYDHLIFEITALNEQDFEILSTEYRMLTESNANKTQIDANLEIKDEKILKFTRDFWFEISSFYGQGFEVIDKKTGKKKILDLEPYTSWLKQKIN